MTYTLPGSEFNSVLPLFSFLDKRWIVTQWSCAAHA